MRVGKFRIEAAHLLRVMAILSVDKSGFLVHPCADKRHAKLGAYRTEQEFGRGGNYDVVRPLLCEIPRLKVAAVFIPKVAYDGVSIAKPRQELEHLLLQVFRAVMAAEIDDKLFDGTRDRRNDGLGIFLQAVFYEAI